MNAHIVYSGAAQSAGGQNGLFAGTKFWLSQKVPQRSRFIEEVKVLDPSARFVVNPSADKH